jgi:hypothetical protein
MAGLTVLLLEDDGGMAQALREAVEERGHHVVVVTEPAQWAESVTTTPCDLIVTDLRRDQGGAEDFPGDQAVEEIFEKRFVPVVIHSGVPGLDGRFPSYRSHPMLRIVPKAAESAAKVVESLVDLVAFATELRGVRDAFAASLHQTLTMTVQRLASADPDHWRPMLPYVVRRRVAATFDEPEPGAAGIRAIERYLIPPIATSLLTGDILIARDGNMDANRTRLVLTQSCDLAWASDRRKPQVSKVLVALPAGKADVRRRALKGYAGALREGEKRIVREIAYGNFSAGFVFLPKVPGAVSGPLAYDLKALELLDITSIEHGSKDGLAPFDWVRAASQDSPFREQMVWALYAQQGRPALPDMDCEDVAKDVTAVLDRG